MYYVPVTDYKLQELTFNDYKLQELTFKCLNLYFVRVIRTLKEGIEGSQMLFYVWFEFTSWLRGVGQGKGAWDCFLTIWAWDSCAFCNGKIKELDYWEIQPLLGLLDHGKVPVIN